MDNLKGIQVISGIQRYLKNSQLYAILGAQNENEMGRLLLYRSQDVVDWHFEGEIKTNLTQFGYMWECPDYFRLKMSYSCVHKALKLKEINLEISINQGI